jgi:hypothetical protein
MADIYGANPINVQWTVIRGDTARLRVDFMNGTSSDHQDTSSWTYAASAYNPKTKIVDTLQVTPGTGYVDITALPAVTATWGTGTYAPIVAELSFDLQITVDEETVWTPIIGSIVVVPDITSNNQP